MIECSLCGSSNTTAYNPLTRIGSCKQCGFNFIHMETGIVRQKSMAIISNFPRERVEKANELLDTGDRFAAEGKYSEALETYAVGSAVDPNNVIIQFARFNVTRLINPKISMYQMQYVPVSRALLDSIDDLATEEDYAKIENRYNVDIRRNTFSFWYDGLKEDVGTYWKIVTEGSKKVDKCVLKLRAQGINFGFRKAMQYATAEESQMLKALCEGRDMLIIDRIVFGHLGFVTGSSKAIIPQGTLYIYKEAFKDAKLSVVKTPKSLMSIDSWAFSNAEIDQLFMDAVTDTDPPLEIADRAFFKAKIGEINGDVSLIKNGAFRSAELGDAKFGNVKVVGTGAFSGAKIGKLSMCLVDDVYDGAFEKATFDKVEIESIKKCSETAFTGAQGSLRLRSAKRVDLESIASEGGVKCSEGGNRIPYPDFKKARFSTEDVKSASESTGVEKKSLFGAFRPS